MFARIRLAAVIAATLAAAPSRAADPPPEAHRYYYIHVQLESWQPEEPLASFRDHGSGGCSAGGTFGTGVKTTRQTLSIEVSCKPDPKRFLVDVTISKSDTEAKVLDEQFDLTELKTQSLELDRDEDGRLYRLSLVPKINIAEPPKVFDPASLQPHSWHFLSSPVVVNDQTYVGQLGMGGGTLVGISIGGIARCEFSLLPLKDAQPTGVLDEGTIRLSRENLTVEISNVRNGPQSEVLKGGPYKVWVRWTEPEVAEAAAAREMIRSQIELLERRRAEGDTTVSEYDLHHLRDLVDWGKPMLLGSWSREVRADERATPEKPEPAAERK